jgi:nucleotide sugar dehydrogenase
MMAASLKRKIESRKAKIAVLGLGYVGLPLAVNFAKQGYSVHGLDKDQDRVDHVRERVSYISDIPTKDVAAVVQAGRLDAGMDFSVISDMDVLIICVPTPLKSKYTPDISYIVDAVRTIRRYLRKGTLIVLESTTYPGTTKELILPEIEKSGLKGGKDFFLAFSPERIDPGNSQYDVTKITKVVGGVTPESGRLTKALYEKIICKVHCVATAEAAEMTKLLENSFRIINIGWINELAMMCHKLGVDIWEVIEAAKTKPFGFMPFYPGLGVGGHCIPDDPLYLYWKAKQYGFSSKYIKISADTNSYMTQYAVERLRDILAGKGKDMKGARIFILGVTYKKDVKDLRKSPPLKLLQLLQAAGCQVDYHDPIIPYLDFPGIHLTAVPLTPKTVKASDCIVIATDHTKVDYAMVRRHARLIFDIRNVYKNTPHTKVIKL